MIRMLRSVQFAFPVLLVCVLVSCEEPQALNPVQTISHVAWRNDGSDEMIALIQKFNADQVSVFPPPEFTLYGLNVDGSIARDYNTPDKAIVDFSFTTFQTNDNKSATLQMGVNTYRVNLTSGDVISLASSFHLIVASPDGKYIVGSHSPAGQPIKTITVYDVSALPARKVTAFDYANIDNSRGVWFADNSFGITVNVEAGTSKDLIFVDTLGTVLDTLVNASSAPHNVVYHPSTNALFFRTGSNTIHKYDLTTKQRIGVVTSSVENFDVTADENYVVFTKYEGGNLLMIKKDIVKNEESLVTDDLLWGVFISPSADKIAYIQNTGLYFDAVRVIAFSK